MTHGPAYGLLDLTSRNERAGCSKVAEAVQRCKPKLHCFGHIHEAYGARLVSLNGDGAHETKETTCSHEDRDGSSWIDAKDVVEREQSLVINAAMLDDEGGCTQAPWVVDLQLQQGEPRLQSSDDEDDRASESEDESEEEDEAYSDEDA